MWLPSLGAEVQAIEPSPSHAGLARPCRTHKNDLRWRAPWLQKVWHEPLNRWQPNLRGSTVLEPLRTVPGSAPSHRSPYWLHYAGIECLSPQHLAQLPIGAGERRQGTTSPRAFEDGPRAFLPKGVPAVHELLQLVRLDIRRASVAHQLGVQGRRFRGPAGRHEQLGEPAGGQALLVPERLTQRRSALDRHTQPLVILVTAGEEWADVELACVATSNDARVDQSERHVPGAPSAFPPGMPARRPRRAPR